MFLDCLATNTFVTTLQSAEPYDEGADVDRTGADSDSTSVASDYSDGYGSDHHHVGAQSQPKPVNDSFAMDCPEQLPVVHNPFAGLGAALRFRTAPPVELAVATLEAPHVSVQSVPAPKTG